jgi:C_GCAxxG_C_C family probable redox protein
MDFVRSLALKFRRSGERGDVDAVDVPALAVETFRNGINCTQAILSAWGARHGLDRDTALRIGGAFGSGMNMGETCGAVTGALMVIGLRHARVSRAGFFSRSRTERETLAFIERFKARNGTVSCKELLGCDLGTQDGRAAARRDRSFKTRCPMLVRDAAEILEEMERAQMGTSAARPTGLAGTRAPGEGFP